MGICIGRYIVVKKIKFDASSRIIANEVTHEGKTRVYQPISSGRGPFPGPHSIYQRLQLLPYLLQHPA